MNDTLILFLVLTAVGMVLVALLLWRIQFTFFPFNRRREEALRMRSLAEMDQRRAAWAMGSPGGSCLKEGKTVVIPPTLAEAERAWNIPQTPSSLRPPSPPSSPATPLITASPIKASPSGAVQATIAATTPRSSPSAPPDIESGPVGRD